MVVFSSHVVSVDIFDEFLLDLGESVVVSRYLVVGLGVLLEELDELYVVRDYYQLQVTTAAQLDQPEEGDG